MFFNMFAMLLPSIILIIPLFIIMDRVYTDVFITSYFVLSIITITSYIVYKEIKAVINYFDDSQTIIYSVVFCLIMSFSYPFLYQIIMQFENFLPEITSYIVANLFYTMVVLKISEINRSKSAEPEKEES